MSATLSKGFIPCLASWWFWVVWYVTGHMDTWSYVHCHTSFESSPLSQAVFCGILFQWIKPLYKVSDSVGHMVLPSGKENPYLEYISVPLEMNYCPLLQWRGCTVAGWFWRQCWIRGFWLERLVGGIVLAVTSRSALRRGSPCKISHPCHQGYSVDEPIVPKMEWSTTVWLTSTIQVNLCGASSMNKVFWWKKAFKLHAHLISPSTCLLLTKSPCL